MGKLIVEEDGGNLNPAPEGWIWIKPSTGEIYERVGGAWVLQATLSLDGHSHPTHGDINFIGTISADGSQGLTGEKTLGGYKFTFKKGLLTGFEPV